MFCIFIRVYYVTYIEMQFDNSKLRNFRSSWKMVKNTINICWRLFLHKTNKKFKDLDIRGYDVTYAEFKIL